MTTAATTTTTTGRAGLLRRAPAFRALWLSRTVSLLGDGVSRVALVLLAAREGPRAVGLVLLANTLPRLLGPVAGAVADRVEQRRLLLACELGQAMVVALVALLLPPLPLLLALVAISGLLATLFTPAGRSAVPSLVAAGDLTAANALLGTALNLQVVAGPALGGLLVVAAGPRAAFAANALAFCASALLLGRLPRLAPDRAGRLPAGLLAETARGLGYVARTPAPRALFCGLLLLVAFAAVDNVALVFLVGDVLGGGAGAFGGVQAAHGAGMLAASLAVAKFGAGWPPYGLLLAGVTANGVGLMLTGLAPGVAAAAATQALAGSGNAAEVVATDTIVQRVVPRHLLGRAFGAMATAAQAGSAIAYTAAAPLLGMLSPGAVLVAAGAGVLLTLAVLIPPLRRAAHRPVEIENGSAAPVNP
jgi:MFS family permease